jgi:hypothetical protein
MIAVTPNKEYIEKVWNKVAESKGFWSQLEGADFEHFYYSCMNSAQLIDMGFGMGRITHLVLGHSCRVHAVFWSRDAYKKIDEVALALLTTAKGLRLRRIECVVPSDVRSLERYLLKLGFRFEGRMASFYKGKSAFFDGDLYAMTF